MNIGCTYLVPLQHIREIGGDGFQCLFVSSTAKEPLESRTLRALLSLNKQFSQFSASYRISEG